MTTKLQLLLIEDSEDDAFLLARRLKRDGYEIELKRVDTEDEMRAALDRHQWDVIISDYSMPNFSGLAALQVAQEYKLDIPFIIVSGAIGEERAVDVVRAGANDYVMKDSLTRLAPAIERSMREVEESRARKAAEKQVIQLSRALAQSASMVIIADQNGMIEYINATFTQKTGYPPETLLGQDFRVIFSQETPQAMLDTMWSLIHDGHEWRGEFQAMMHDESLYWAAITVSAIRNPEGSIGQFLLVLEDVSQRKQLENEIHRYTELLEHMVEERTQELQQTKEKIEIILNTGSDAIALVDLNGDIQTLNPAFHTLFEGRVTRNIEEIMPTLSSQDDMTAISKALNTVLSEKGHQHGQATLIRRAGRQIAVDFALTPVEDSEQALIGFVLSVRDITHLKEIERFKEEFVANAAHDLGNPIATLRTRLYMLKAQPERLDHHVEILEQQVSRLSNLVDELRTLSELDSQFTQLNRQMVDLNQIAKDVVTGHYPLAQTKTQKLEFLPSERELRVYIDVNKLERAIANLVANAIEYTPDKGTVSVSLSKKGEHAICEVVDTGQGIEARHIDHIFERFYRTERARENHSGGTGLGLAIVKDVVEAHEGSITVTSTIDKGTTFTLNLPIPPETSIAD